jgi:hypothetical protein
MKKKKGIASIDDAPVFAGDPAPQQLTAPCRKYSGRQRPAIEQAVCLSFDGQFPSVFRASPSSRSRAAL